jgi:hypothetical protein
MPGTWLPWPGKVKARMGLGNLFETKPSRSLPLGDWTSQATGFTKTACRTFLRQLCFYLLQRLRRQTPNPLRFKSMALGRERRWVNRVQAQHI